MTQLPALRPWLSQPTALPTSAANMWEHIARLPHQYVLVGDNHHYDIYVQYAFWKGMDISLGAGGPRHIGLETDIEGQGLAALCCNPKAHERGIEKITEVWSSIVGASLPLPLRLYVGAKAARAINGNLARQPQIHCLNTLHSDRKNSHDADWDRHAQRHMGDIAANGAGPIKRLKTALHLMVEGVLPPRWQPTHAAREAEEDRRNMNLDFARAAMFRNAIGQERGVLYYGAAHFASDDNRNITHWLPREEQIVVMLGGHHLNNRYYDFNRTPPIYDFFVDSKTSTAFVTPRALARGLWPKP